MVLCSMTLFKLVKVLLCSHSSELTCCMPFHPLPLDCQLPHKVKFKSSRFCCTNVFGGAFLVCWFWVFKKYLAQIITFPFALLSHTFVAMLNTLILITPFSHLNKFEQSLSDYLNVPVYEK